MMGVRDRGATAPHHNRLRQRGFGSCDHDGSDKLARTAQTSGGEKCHCVRTETQLKPPQIAAFFFCLVGRISAPAVKRLRRENGSTLADDSSRSERNLNPNYCYFSSPVCL